MTKVVLLHYSAPPIVGGVETVLGHQARLMADAGHEVRIVAGRGEQTDPRVPFIQVPLADSRHPDILAMKAELDAGNLPSGFSKLADSIAATLKDVLDDADVLIAHNVCSLHKNLALTAAVQNLSNIFQVIAWHHDLAWTAMRYQAELHEGYPWDLLRQAWHGVKQVTISEVRQQELADLFRISPDEIAVIPNGVDISEFHKFEEQTYEFVRRLNLLNASPFLLLPVRITPRKNIELAIRVCTNLVRDFPDIKLVVTGPLGPHNPANVNYLEMLVTLRKELQLENVVHFLAELTDQFIPDKVISDFYHLSDALFLPSIEEGFGIPILEAGLAGLPIFCSDLPALRELVGSNAMYFLPDADPVELANRIVNHLTFDSVFRMRVRARREFSWEGIYTRQIAPLLVI